MTMVSLRAASFVDMNSAIIVTRDYLCYNEPKNPYNFFILIFNELFKFKTSDERQH